MAKVNRVPRGMPKNWVRIGDTASVESGGKLLKFPRGTALYAARTKGGKTHLAIAGPLMRGAKGSGSVESIVYRAKRERYRSLGLGDVGRPFIHFFGRGVKAEGISVTQGKKKIPMVLLKGGKLSIGKRGILN